MAILMIDLLVKPAQEAGMKVPPNADEYDVKEFLHFNLFVNVQLGAPMPYPSAHWDNAKAIASMNLEGKTEVSLKELEDAGVRIGFSK